MGLSRWWALRCFYFDLFSLAAVVKASSNFSSRVNISYALIKTSIYRFMENFLLVRYIYIAY